MKDKGGQTSNSTQKNKQKSQMDVAPGQTTLHRPNKGPLMVLHTIPHHICKTHLWTPNPTSSNPAHRSSIFNMGRQPSSCTKPCSTEPEPHIIPRHRHPSHHPELSRLASRNLSIHHDTRSCRFPGCHNSRDNGPTPPLLPSQITVARPARIRRPGGGGGGGGGWKRGSVEDTKESASYAVH